MFKAILILAIAPSAISSRIKITDENVDYSGLAPKPCLPSGEKTSEGNANCARVGIEVEFNDGMIERSLNGNKQHCDDLLDYGKEWFHTQERYDVSMNWGSGASVPLFNLESEVRYRDTMECATGPTFSTNGIMNNLRRIGEFAYAIKGDTHTIQHMMGVWNKGSKKPAQLSALAADCADNLEIKAHRSSQAMLGGVQINFEMKISNIYAMTDPETIDSTMGTLGIGGIDYWKSARACLDSAMPELLKARGTKKMYFSDRGAFIIVFLFAGKTSTCQGKNGEISCKIGLDILPKANIAQLEARTKLNWDQIKAVMSGNAKCSGLVPPSWHPDQKIFNPAKKPLGLGKNTWDKLNPFIVVELRGGSARLNGAVKSYLTELEMNRQGDAASLQTKIACLQRWGQRGWPFSDEGCDITTYIG